MNDTKLQSINTPSQSKAFLGLNDENYPGTGSVENEWYHDNLDIVFPVIIIATGLFQYVLRKWLLPVSENVISKLENQLPTQGLIYNPQFGVYLMAIGALLLIALNLNKLL